MFKIKMEWELNNGKKFSEWTIPWDIAYAEKETGETLYSIIIKEAPPTLEQQFHMAYNIQRRITDKPVGSFENWKSSVVHILSKDFQTTNFTNPEASTDS